MQPKYDLVSYTMISCRQFNGTNFVLQIPGKFISASVGFQNLPGGMPPDPPILVRHSGPCIFTAWLSCPDARMLKNLLKPLLLAN